MAPMKRKEPKIELIRKESITNPKSDYRPEERGSNKMKVTQLSVCRLPRLIHSSPEEVNGVRPPVSGVPCRVSNLQSGPKTRDRERNLVPRTKPETGDRKRNFVGERYEEDEKNRVTREEAEAMEIEIAVGCLLGSRLNNDPRSSVRISRKKGRYRKKAKAPGRPEKGVG